MLLYNSAGTDNCSTGSDCSTDVTVTLDNLATKLGGIGSHAVVTHYRVDQTHGNPRALWQSYGGASNPYPTPQQFAALRAASEIYVMNRTNFTVSATPVNLQTILPLPSVSLFHICALAANSKQHGFATPSLAPSRVENVSVRATPTVDPPTVFVRWDAPTGGSGCIQTYVWIE